MASTNPQTNIQYNENPNWKLKELSQLEVIGSQAFTMADNLELMPRRRIARSPRYEANLAILSKSSLLRSDQAILSRSAVIRSDQTFFSRSAVLRSDLVERSK